MTSFIETQFPPTVAYMSTGGPSFNTTVNMNKAGFETRQVNWITARHMYNVNYGIRNQADFDAIIKLFHVCQGKATGFRFKDWADFKSCPPIYAPANTDQLIGVGDGNNTHFQLVKAYTVGNLTFTRKIKKPVSGSVLVTTSAGDRSFTVDTTTGIITFLTGNIPGAGVQVTAGYQFDVPVRFDVDQLIIEQSKPQLCQIQNLRLIEDMNV